MIINGKKITIDRKSAVISEIDRIYCGLVRKILTEGKLCPNRTGVDTYAIAGWTVTIDISEVFPIMETKFVNAKSFANEIQWIHQVQSNRVQWLRDRDNLTWDQWVVDEDGIYRIYEPKTSTVFDPEREVPLMYQVKDPKTGKIIKKPVLDKYNKPVMVKSWDVVKGKTNPRTIKEAILFGKEYAGTIGKAYGGVNAETLAPQRTEATLKEIHDGIITDDMRRMIISLWQDGFLPEAVLPSCVWSSQYTVIDDTLHAVVSQRSADVPVGLPFNIAQYALLLCMFAKANGFKVGTLTWTITNAHIYVDQIEGIKKQLKRYDYMEEYSNIIQTSTDEELETLYDKICDLYDRLLIRANIMLDGAIDGMKVSEVIEKLKAKDENLAKDYEEAYERKMCFEHIITRRDPRLELDKTDSIFEYSTDYVKKGDPYLKENPIGNKQIRLVNYTSAPFIKLPVAQ